MQQNQFILKSIFKYIEVHTTNSERLTWMIFTLYSVTSKKLPNVYKSCPKMIFLENWEISTPLKKLSNMWTIWAKSLLPQALKSCPKCYKSPNLVTLFTLQRALWFQDGLLRHSPVSGVEEVDGCKRHPDQKVSPGIEVIKLFFENDMSIQYMAPGSNQRPLEHKSSPITTRPWNFLNLDFPKIKKLKKVCYHVWTCTKMWKQLH